MMNSNKKHTSAAFFLFFLLPALVFSQESFSSIASAGGSEVSPPAGIYHDSQRIIAFSGDKAGNIILKTYYGWYYDAYYEVEKYPLEITPLELDGGLYTRYWKKSEVSNGANTVYWRPCTNFAGFTIIPPIPDESIYGFLTTPESVYRIRYWQVSVPYTDQKASVIDTDANLQYEVDKYISVGTLVYTCVNGLGLRVRNYDKKSLEKADILGFTDLRISEDGLYAVMGESEYTFFEEEDLDSAVKEHNSRKKPPRKPLFEYMDLNFYYDEIERLRK